MLEKKEIKKEIVIGVFLLVFSVLSLLSIYVFSDIEIFSASQQNISMCNVQGYIFSSDLLAVSNGTNISCTIARNNGINTTYTTLTGKGFPTDDNTYNNSYRCTMTCSNVIADTITVLAYNSSGNGTSTSTMSGSTKVLNITFTDYVAPTITSISGNKAGYTNQTISIEINATDDVGVVGGNITLGNGTVINTSLVGSNYTANLTLPSNSLLTINYTAVVYDTANNNATSATYYITISDNIAPTAVATVNQSSVDQNINIQFNASNSSDNIGITNYTWRFNDSTAINTSGEPLHKFADPGTYNISFTATDTAGNNGTAYLTITVRDSGAPFAISNSPANTSANISLMTSINITFNEAMLLSTLTMDNIDIRDNGSNKVYGNITFDSTLNKTIIWPYVLLSESMTYIVNASTNVQDTSTNNITAAYKFNFTTKARDTDNDNIPDSEETDDDNDGVLDENDKVKGNASNIKIDLFLTTINVSINSSTNLSNASVFNASANVEINNGTAPIIIFSIDFSNTTLDLTNLSIYESDNQTISAIIIHGLKLATGQTKTIYLANKTNYTSVCVKDMEVTSFSQITQACNSTNEFKVVCNNTEQYSYTCIHNTTINKFMINGLNYSGVREINYAPTQTTPGGGNGGGGGGGGGGAEKPLTIATAETPAVITSPVFPSGGGEEEIKEPIAETESKEGEGAAKEPIESKETGEEKGLIQEAESKEGISLAGKAYKVIIENKANLSLLLLISLLAASVLMFNIIHEKRKKE